jgi:hypothetical protein
MAAIAAGLFLVMRWIPLVMVFRQYPAPDRP